MQSIEKRKLENASLCNVNGPSKRSKADVMDENRALREQLATMKENQLLKKQLADLRQKVSELEEKATRSNSSRSSSSRDESSTEDTNSSGSGGSSDESNAHFRGAVCKDDRLLLTTLKSLSDQSFCVSDPHTKGNPIIHANESFFKMTGYTASEILNRNCRLLQGPKTDPKTIAYMSELLSREEEVETVILNYKKDKTPFWNHLYITGTRDEKGKLINYIGIQKEITEAEAKKFMKKRKQVKKRSKKMKNKT